MTGTYTFEHTDSKKLKRMIFWGAILFFGIPVLTIAFISAEEAVIIKMMLVGLVAIGGAMYLLSRGIKCTGKAELTQNGVTFYLFDSTQTIPFEAVQDYLITYHSGVVIRLRFGNGQGFTVEANSNFCNASDLQGFSVDLEKAIDGYNSGNAPQLSIKKAKNPFAKDGLLTALKILSLLLVVVAVPVLIYGDHIRMMSLAFYLAILAVFWKIVIKARKEEEK